VFEIPVKNAQHALEYKEQLLEAGLVLNQDFSWGYVPSQYDGWDDTTHTEPMVYFEFQDPKMETFFQLKWGLS